MVIPGLNSMSSMMELFNLKKLKQMDVSGFSKELIFNQTVDYRSKVVDINFMNQLTLDKIKEMSMNIQLLKGALKTKEDQVSKTQKSKKRVRRTKKELKLNFKVS
jgi:hypothetical protein